MSKTGFVSDMQDLQEYKRRDTKRVTITQAVEELRKSKLYNISEKFDFNHFRISGPSINSQTSVTQISSSLKTMTDDYEEPVLSEYSIGSVHVPDDSTAELLNEAQLKGLEDLKVDIIRENEQYLEDHPEVLALIENFVEKMLQRKPFGDFVEEAVKHFTRPVEELAAEVDINLAGAGYKSKTSMKTLTKLYHNRFKTPKKRKVPDNILWGRYTTMSLYNDQLKATKMLHILPEEEEEHVYTELCDDEEHKSTMTLGMQHITGIESKTIHLLPGFKKGMEVYEQAMSSDVFVSNESVKDV